MPNTLATALWPTAAAQIVARISPSEVDARMIGRDAPTATAGTTPTRTMPRASDPAMKTGSPSSAGLPVNGAGTAAGAGAAVSLMVADSPLVAVIAAPSQGSSPDR